MRSLITGGAGFIGSHLADALIQSGHDVTIMDDFSTGRMENINPRCKCPHEVSGYFDHIYHLAAVVGVERVIRFPENTMTVNAGGTLEILKRSFGRIFIASSSEVYGESFEPLSEDMPCKVFPSGDPRLMYTASKLMAEIIALSSGKDVVIGRIFNTVGPRQVGDYGMVLPRFIQWAMEGEPIQVNGDGSQVRCFCHVKDTVDAIMGLMAESAGGIFNIGSDQPIMIRDLAQLVKSIVKSDSQLVFKKGPCMDYQHRVPNIDKIRNITGWRPTRPLDYTIREIADDRREGMPVLQRAVS